MKLTPETVYQYLHKRQLLDEAAVVKGHFKVHPVKTRNTILKVVVTPERSLFVKQYQNDKLSKAMFEREVYAYTLFKNDEAFSAIARIVPEMLDHDEEAKVIISRLWCDAENIVEHYWKSGNFDTDIARGQAHILSACHVSPDPQTDTAAFPKALPWVLQLHRFNAEQFFIDNPASTSVIRLIKENASLQQQLVNLSATWQKTHFIHGDVKWINFMVRQNKGQTEQTLIDWELADIGDPMWDVGGLLQSYIAAWVMSLDNRNPGDHSLPAHLKFYEMQHMQPSAQAFLETYFSLRQFAPENRDAFYIRALQFTAARIIQTSLEGITYFTNIEANNMRLIQLALNMLEDPEGSLEQLFGIKIQSVYV